MNISTDNFVFDKFLDILALAIAAGLIWQALSQITDYFHMPSPTYFQTVGFMVMWQYTVRGTIFHVKQL